MFISLNHRFAFQLGFLVLVPMLARTQGTYTTTFPRTENPLSEGGKWINGGTTGLRWNNCYSSGGFAGGVGPASVPYSDPTCILAGSWGPLQTVTATVRVSKASPNYYQEVELRLHTTITPNSITGYEINCAVKGSHNYLQVVRWNGRLGDFTYLNATGPGGSCGNNDVLKGTIDASGVIRVYINGALVLTASADWTYPTGNPGIGFDYGCDGTYANFGFSSFTATDGSTGSNPVPAIASLAPASATAGSAAFALTVNGTGFVNGSVVRWNGSSRTTTLVSATQVRAAITAADIAAAGTAQVTVFNPTPGGGTSGNSTFTVTAASPATVTALQCTPTIVASGGASTCTVTLSQAASSGGAAVALASNNAALAVPTSITVGAGSTTAAFIGTAATVTTNQTVTITAALNGSSATASVSVQAAITGSLAAAYAFDEGVGSTTADSSGNGVTGQIQGASWTTNARHGKALSFNGSSNYVDIANPSSLQGTGSMTWSSWIYATANPTDDGNIIAKSSWGNKNIGWQFKTTPDTGRQTFGILISPDGSNYAERCSKTVRSLNTWYHVAAVYNASTATLDIYVNGVLDNGVLYNTVPRSQYSPSLSVTVGKRSDGYLFKGVIDDLRVYNRALTQADIQNDMNTPVTTAGMQSLTSGLAPMIVRSEALDSTATDFASLPRISALSCRPKTVTAGGQVTCELDVAQDGAARIQLASSSSQMRIPAIVATRGNQSRLSFQASVDPVATQQEVVLTATLGGASAKDTIQVIPASAPILTALDRQFARFGTPLSFMIAAVDPSDLPFQLMAGDLPAGAMFDPASGRFEWTPSASQAGAHRITFEAVNSARQSSTVEVTIDVDSGAPVLSSSEQFACSPGAIGGLSGKWFAESGDTFSDPSGNSLNLGGTKVMVNNLNQPVLFVSATRVNFLCPVLEPGAPLSIAVETASAQSEPMISTMQAASPTILSLDGSGRNQGLIFLSGTNDMAVERTPRNHGQPAQPGDEILIWCTGLGQAVDAPTGTFSVKVGGVDAEVESVRAVPGHAGIYTVQARVPAATVFGDAVPVQIQVTGAAGGQSNSNTVTIAVEPVSQ